MWANSGSRSVEIGAGYSWKNNWGNGGSASGTNSRGLTNSLNWKNSGSGKTNLDLKANINRTSYFCGKDYRSTMSKMFESWLMIYM